MAVSLICMTAVDQILPEGNTAKTVKWLMGVVVVFMLVQPGMALIDAATDATTLVPVQTALVWDVSLRQGVEEEVLRLVRTYEGFEQATISLTWRTEDPLHIESISIYAPPHVIDTNLTVIKRDLCGIYNITVERIHFY